MKELKKLCTKLDIPFISVFATGNSDIETKYEMTGLFPGVQGIKLKDDKLKDVFAIMSGYNDKETVDFSDDDDEDAFPDEV